MYSKHTEWSDQDIAHAKADCGDTTCVFVWDRCQPEFGISIGWNEPRKLWRPYFVLTFWHWHIQFGWLF